MRISKAVWVPAVRLAVLILLALSSGSGRLDSLLGRAGLNRVAQQNQEYLQTSFDRSVRIFGILSVVKVGLAMVEGTEVGVGFNLEVGDIVEAAHDYVNTAWYVVMAGGVVLLGIQYLITAVAKVDHFFLTAALILFTGAVLARMAGPRLKIARRLFFDAGIFVGLLTAALYLLVPLSIRGGSILSKTITRPSLEEVETGIASMKKDLFEEKQESQGFFGALRQSKDRLQNATRYLKEKTNQMVLWILKLITVYLFDCIVFPLLLFAGLFWFARGCLRYLLRITERSHLRDDLLEVIHAGTKVLPRMAPEHLSSQKASECKKEGP